MYTNNATLTTAIVASRQGEYNHVIPQHQWVEVLVDCPGVTELFIYRLPPQLEVKPGDILSVPFRTQTIGGIAIRKVTKPPQDIPIEKIRNIEDVVSAGFFPDFYWELLNQVAAYYYTPLIQVIRVALPPGLLGKSQRRIRLIANKKTFLSSHSSLSIPLSPAARKIIDLLQAQTLGNYSFIYLSRQVRGAYRAVRELKRLGLIETYLEAPRLTKPKLQKAVILSGNSFARDLTTRQREILEVLRRRGGEMWQTELLQACNTSTPTIKTLEKKGYIVVEEKEVLRTDTSQNTDETFTGQQAKNLTPAQQTALETINNINGYASILLHGVTGSGKTEVYLQAIAPLLTAGKSALVLVPEIGLTPQLTDRFRARFGTKVSVYHSALSDGERYDTWRQMLAGEPQVVIGTRSAVFAPLPNLGLIILDEEHDSSFKQDSPMPTYHARKVATWRAELENCPLVLGSATPSLESWVNVGKGGDGESTLVGRLPPLREVVNPKGETRGEGDKVTLNSSLLTPNSFNPKSKIQNPKSHYLSLPERVNSRPLPPVEIVDMREELHQANRSIFSKSLQQGLQELVETGQQGILFIHRRGHSTFVSCRSCGYVMECPNCDVSLSYHQTEAGAAQVLRCHYCNYATPHPKNCPDCCSPYLKFFGSGTQRVAQELTKQFPDLHFIRFDSDTTRTKGAHRTLLTRFAKGEAHLLIGTQMLTKGLDLPQVTLVGVVSADGLLHLSDYRASERAFQTLTQVAGRAGRGEDPGRVIIQTYTTEHPVIEAVQQHDYQTFIQDELEQREALNYPPYGRLILLRLSSSDDLQVENTATEIAEKLQQQSGIDVLGPAPANILRVANRYRWQILLKFAPEDLPQLPDWEEIRQLCPDSVSLTIDIDPLNIM